jgi:hypothetical protein
MIKQVAPEPEWVGGASASTSASTTRPWWQVWNVACAVGGQQHYQLTRPHHDLLVDGNGSDDSTTHATTLNLNRLLVEAKNEHMLLHQQLVDFQDHLDNIGLDWTNRALHTRLDQLVGATHSPSSSKLKSA